MKKIYRVLLVEDDFGSAKVVIHTLNRYNFEVTHAIEGNSALNFIDSESYDLLISDIMMPGIDGFQMLEKAGDKLKNTPKIMLTAVGDRQKVQKAAQFNVQMFLLKPISSNKIVEKVREVLRLDESDLVNKKSFPFKMDVKVIDKKTLQITLSGVPEVDFSKELFREVERVIQAGNHNQIETIRILVNTEVALHKQTATYLEYAIEPIKKLTSVSPEKINCYGGFFRELTEELFSGLKSLNQCNIQYK